MDYNKNIAIKIKIKTTATVPQVTNFSKIIPSLVMVLSCP